MSLEEFKESGLVRKKDRPKEKQAKNKNKNKKKTRKN